MKRFSRLTALCLASWLVVCTLSCERKPQRPPRTLHQVAVIPKGTTHEFWKSIHAGAMKAGEPHNIKVIWKGPLREDDREEQIKIVEDFINRKVAGIVLAPLDDTALAPVVQSAVANKIPVVIIDSDLKGDAHTSFCATDNFKGGQMAGEELARLLDGKGKVAMLRYQEGSGSTTNRENGFLDAIKKHKGIEVIVDNQYAGATAETAQQKSENLLAPLKKPDGGVGVDGIFCCNESTTFGMLRALQDARLAGKVKFVGFDASTKLVEALSAGEIDALVVQDPMNMGYVGVQTMASIIRGEPVAKVIDTGVKLVTKANMAEPEINELLHPPIEQYLKE